MKKILWFLLELFDNNHGFSTPIQKRFKVGDICQISDDYKWYDFSPFKPGEKVRIIETARHDYFIESIENSKKKEIVYQFELTKIS